MYFDKIFDLTDGVHFRFYDIDKGIISGIGGGCIVESVLGRV